MRKRYAASVLLSAIQLGCSSPDVIPEGDTDPVGKEAGEAETGGNTQETSATDATEEGGTTEDEATDGTPPVGWVCGDGVVEGNEVCDDGRNDGSYGGCLPDCSGLGPYCGDGEINGAETCDLGEANGSSDCNPECQVPGTVLATAYETIDVSPSLSGQANGMRVTRWGDHVTLVVGSHRTTVWQLDATSAAGELPSIETVSLRQPNLPPYRQLNPLTGALGLEGGGLLVTGSVGKNAFILDDALDVLWTLSEPNVGSGGLVGVAPIPGGAFIGGYEADTYWARAIAESGETLWNAHEGFVGSSLYGRDARSLGEGRAVLLADGGGATRVRIYDSAGSLVLHRTLDALSTYRMICEGRNGFFLMPEAQLTLVGFDSQVNPTFNAALPPPSGTVWWNACVTRADNSPIVAYTGADDGMFLHLVALDGGPSPAWTNSTWDDSIPAYAEPTVYLEEDSSRVWVFAAGGHSPGVRGLFAALVAI